MRVPVAVHRVGFSQSHYGGRRWQGKVRRRQRRGRLDPSWCPGSKSPQLVRGEVGRGRGQSRRLAGGGLKGVRAKAGGHRRLTAVCFHVFPTRSESFLPCRAQPERVPPAASGGGCGGPSPGPPGLSPNLRASLPPPPPRPLGAVAAVPEMRPSRGRP